MMINNATLTKVHRPFHHLGDDLVKCTSLLIIASIIGLLVF